MLGWRLLQEPYTKTHHHGTREIHYTKLLLLFFVCSFVSDHFWFRLCFTHFFKVCFCWFFLLLFLTIYQFFLTIYHAPVFSVYCVLTKCVLPSLMYPYWLTGRETSSYLLTYLLTCSPEALSESMVLSCPNRTANVVPDRWAQTWIIDRQCRDLFATITRHSVPSNWAWQDSGRAHRHFPHVKLVGGNSK